MIFDYMLPAANHAASHAGNHAGNHDGRLAAAKKKPAGKKKKPATGGPVRTQMVPENPADGLGYDPKIIPTEKI